MPSEDLKSAIRSLRARVILGAVILLQLLFVTYTNLFATEEVLDNDMAKLFVHTAHMWKQKSLFIPGWAYDTTLELDCPALLAVPIYGITGNIFTSIGISNIIFTLILLYVCRVFLKRAGFDVISRRLALVAVLVPYSFGQLLYYDMLYFGGSYYSMKVMVPILCMAMLMGAQGSVGGKVREKTAASASGLRRIFTEDVICNVLLVLFAFLTGLSSGAYVFVAGMVPVFAGAFLMKGFKDRRIDLQAVVYGGASILGMVIGKLLPVSTVGPEYELISFEGLKDSLEALFICFVEMTGMLTDSNTPVFTARGMECALKGLLTVAVLAFMAVYTARAFRAFRKKDPDTRDMLSVYVMMLLGANLFIVIFTGLSNGSRYLLLSFCPLLLVFAAYLMEKVRQFRGAGISVCIASGFILLTILSDITVLKGDPFPFMRDDHYKYDGLLETLEKYPGRDVIFLDDVNTAEILRARDLDSGREYLTYISEGSEYFEPGVMAYDYYYAARDNEYMSRDHILIVNDLYTGEDVMPEDPMFDGYEPLDTFQVYRLYSPGR